MMQKTGLSDEQKLDWLRLIRSENVGPRTFRVLINKYGGAASALDALPELARRNGKLLHQIASRADVLAEWDMVHAKGGRFIALGEADYPKTLQAIDTAPPLICMMGDASLLNRPGVAIVGSRNASAAGASFTEKLSHDLGHAGFVIISGLARGIDTRAHRASLKTGTIAVLAGGLNKVYPSENIPLLERIIEEGGAVVCEMPLQWEPRGRDFPRRNRIVSGLSYGVVVVEAAFKSGTLITARFGLEQGREVFAVPGSPLDPRSEGTNDLIRQGATLCTQASHVVDALNPLLSREDAFVMAEEDRHSRYGDRLWDEMDIEGSDLAAPYHYNNPHLGLWEKESQRLEELQDDPQRIIRHLLSPSPVEINELARQAGLPIHVTQSALLELELDGHLERHGGNRVSLIA